MALLGISILHLQDSLPIFSFHLTKDKKIIIDNLHSFPNQQVGGISCLPHPGDSRVLQSTASSHFNHQNDPWCPDFLDYPVSTTMQRNQLDDNNGDTIVYQSKDLGKINGWKDWADQFIIDNDELASDWNGLLGDTIFADSEPKVETNKSEHLLATPKETCATPGQCSSGNAGPTEQRMRWTPELHEIFVEAVNKLGGGEISYSHLTEFLKSVQNNWPSTVLLI